MFHDEPLDAFLQGRDFLTTALYFRFAFFEIRVVAHTAGFQGFSDLDTRTGTDSGRGVLNKRPRFSI
jgi:hypothetical protein